MSHVASCFLEVICLSRTLATTRLANTTPPPGQRSTAPSYLPGLNEPRGIAFFGGDLVVTNRGNDTIGEYNATTGATINSSFISSGLNDPRGIALSGGDLFVTNAVGNTIGEYNATTGATINSSFISSGLNVPVGIVVSSPSVPD